MKFTLSWLKDHLETSASAAGIADKLTAIGLEVEEVKDPSKTLAPFKVAYVVEAVQHPNADKLRVCKVDAGQGIVQVVCGAPNARTGMKGVFAPVGTYVPGTDLLLKATKIRGVDSNGMLCSARELMLGDDHDGIIDLPADARVGAPALSVLKVDPVFDVSITPNRPDCLGVYGIARDLAAAGIGSLKHKGAAQGIEPVVGKFPCPVPIGLEFAPGTASACPIFAGRVLRGVRNGQSPAWLQDRLKAIGLRPISALVDITNYISYDRGRPLHVYDVAKLRRRIFARLGRAGEELAALDGKTYKITSEMCVIADDSGAIGLGGVMGGETTGCTENTTEVLIESAYFDSARTAKTGRALGIESDARYRFERGVDPAFVLPGLELATKMMLELCGGEASNALAAGHAPIDRREIEFDPHQIERLTGIKITSSQAEHILRELGFEPAPADGKISVRVPTWRPDVDGPADLVEETVRIHGLDKVPSTPISRPAVSAGAILTPLQRRLRLARRAFAERGLTEAVTWSFISHGEAELFGGANATLRLANPISTEMDTMRPSLLAGLVSAARRNADRGLAPVLLFEVGQQFRGDQDADQAMTGALVRKGPAPRHWSGEAAIDTAFAAKADAQAVLSALGAPRDLQITEDAPGWYHPGRSGTLRLGPKLVLAHFGELHPRVLKAFDIEGPIAAAEIFIEAVPEPKARATKARPRLDASDLQPVKRDFAFVVDKGMRAADLVRAAKGVDKALIADVIVFDVYEGKGIEPAKKSIAIEVTLQPRTKTLTDEEIDQVSARVIDAVIKATGAKLRS